jgi:hypothetical protein
MARSYRHTPIVGNGGARSEKRDKQLAHRALRKQNKQRLVVGLEMLRTKEVHDIYAWSKDGKQYLSAPEKHPKLMRK